MALLGAAAGPLSPAGAAAQSPIEGIWTFNGGRVAVQAQPDGSFLGTVVSETRFDDCEHGVGEQVWPRIDEQADGSYWGRHQWYFAGDCSLNPELGLTGWRVLAAADGGRYLRVCFSDPGSPLQPKIFADGDVVDSTYGCADSDLVSATTEFEFSQYLRFPRPKGCLTRKRLRIRVVENPNDPATRISVVLRQGKEVKRRGKTRRLAGKTFAVVNLRGLPAGRFGVRVAIETVLGNHLTGKRTYRRCGSTKRPKAQRRGGQRNSQRLAPAPLVRAR